MDLMRTRGTVLALLIVCVSAPLGAQYRRTFSPTWPARAIYFQAGVHTADMYGDESAMLVAVRGNWQLRRWLLTEFGGYYTRPETSTEEDVDVFGTEVGIQAQVPKYRVRPYVGLAQGVHVTLEPEPGARFVAPSTQVMGGLRALLTSSLLARGEIRLKLDSHEGSATQAKNVELTFGLGFRP
jgi:hypothetical protein